MCADNLNEIAVIFLHHTTCDITLNNYNLIKKFNPDCSVFPVGFSWHNLMENSHAVHRHDSYPNNEQLNKILFNGKSTSSESDLCIYDFFLHHQDFKHYFVIEWDTYCNCSLREYYRDQINKVDTFSAFIFNNKEDVPNAIRKMNVKEWSWYNYFQTLKSPEDKQKLLPYLGGTYPTSLLYYSQKTLHDMVDLLLQNPRLYDNIQNEMRLGTLLQQAGYVLTEFGGDKNQFFEQDNYKSDIAKGIKGYYHPIKEKL